MQKDNDSPFLQLFETFISILSLFIGHGLKLIDMLIHPAEDDTWLSIAGSCLLVMVLGWLVVKLSIRMKRWKR